MQITERAAAVVRESQGEGFQSLHRLSRCEVEGAARRLGYVVRAERGCVLVTTQEHQDQFGEVPGLRIYGVPHLIAIPVLNTSGTAIESTWSMIAFPEPLGDQEQFYGVTATNDAGLQVLKILVNDLVARYGLPPFRIELSRPIRLLDDSETFDIIE